jgi:hypothetical protein
VSDAGQAEMTGVRGAARGKLSRWGQGRSCQAIRGKERQGRTAVTCRSRRTGSGSPDPKHPVDDFEVLVHQSLGLASGSGSCS